MTSHSDYLIIGGGIMGLAVARGLRARHPSASITLIEKENDVAFHASGRNSGVLHAGFYYGADSLKAKFCREGNAAMRQYVKDHHLRINDCGKVVVARNAKELPALYELYKRGQINGVELRLVNEEELAAIEPNAKTFKHALYSPTTAIVDPVEVCQAMRRELESQGVKILTSMPYERRVTSNSIMAGGQLFEARRIINCAGVFADRVAKDFGFCKDYAIVPFKGIYLEYKGDDVPAKCCIYGVPNPLNPFLGVHFSVTVDGKVKIGPTAIPVLGRENYHGLEGVSTGDAVEIVGREAAMFLRRPEFRRLAVEEMRKYDSKYMVSQAAQMFKNLEQDKFTSWTRPGIRAQLMDTRSKALLHDFVVEGDSQSTHVLNAVSPAFTSSLPFAQWIVENYIDKIPPPVRRKGHGR